jgi:hypothetical protein
MPKSVSDHLKNDADRSKGSQEPDDPGQSGNNSMNGQLGHRSPDPLQNGADSDFPEPGQSPEHSFEGEFKNRLSAALREKKTRSSDGRPRPPNPSTFRNH